MPVIWLHRLTVVNGDEMAAWWPVPVEADGVEHVNTHWGPSPLLAGTLIS